MNLLATLVGLVPGRVEPGYFLLSGSPPGFLNYVFVCMYTICRKIGMSSNIMAREGGGGGWGKALADMFYYRPASCSFSYIFFQAVRVQ